MARARPLPTMTVVAFAHVAGDLGPAAVAGADAHHHRFGLAVDQLVQRRAARAEQRRHLGIPARLLLGVERGAERGELLVEALGHALAHRAGIVAAAVAATAAAAAGHAAAAAEQRGCRRRWPAAAPRVRAAERSRIAASAASNAACCVRIELQRLRHARQVGGQAAAAAAAALRWRGGCAVLGRLVAQRGIAARAARRRAG